MSSTSFHACYSLAVPSVLFLNLESSQCTVTNIFAVLYDCSGLALPIVTYVGHVNERYPVLSSGYN